MNGAWHRFRSAALLLARSGTVKERLQSAYRLHLADLDSTQLPAEIRGNFEALRGALTREKPMRGEDAVTASIRKLSSREVDDLAAGLIEMFASFSQLEDLEPLHPAAATASSTVKVWLLPSFVTMVSGWLSNFSPAAALNDRQRKSARTALARRAKRAKLAA